MEAQRDLRSGRGVRGPLFFLITSACLSSLLWAFTPVSSLPSALLPGGPSRQTLLASGGPFGAPWAPARLSPRPGVFVETKSSKEEEGEVEGEGGESESEEGAPKGAPKGRGSSRPSGGPSEEEEEGSQTEGDEDEGDATKSKRQETAAAEQGQEGEGAATPTQEEAGGPVAGTGGPPEAQLTPGAPPPPLPPASEFLPQLSYSDGEEICHSVSCSKVVSGASSQLPIKGCKKVVKCSNCKPGGTPEAKCLGWKPSRQPEMLLRNGTYYGLKRISRSGSLDLAIKWEHENSELDFSPCLIDIKQATLANRELNETGNVRPFAFQRMVQLTLAVVRTPEEGAEGANSTKFSFAFKLNEGLGMARAFSTVAKPVVTPACFQADQRSSVLTLTGDDAAFIVGWFSVPKHKTFPLYPRNFTVRIFCHSASDCSLSQLSICARLSCPIASPQVEKEVLTAEEAMKHPVGDISALAAPAASAGRAGGVAGAVGLALPAGNPLLQQQLMQQQLIQHQLMQQRHGGPRQLQFRGRLGFRTPYWTGASGNPSVSWGVVAMALVASVFSFLLV